MSVVLVVLVAALAIGALRGGRLGAVHLRGWRWLAAALLAQLAGGLVGGVAYPVCLAVSAVLVLVFLARAGLPGRALLVAGLLANALVIARNGAMPVSTVAAARAGVSLRVAVADPRHERATARTALPWLADVVPLPLPVAPEVVSPGDVLVLAGLARLVLSAMGRAPRTLPVARPHLPPLPRRRRPARRTTLSGAAGPPRRATRP